jgi:protein TonB
MVLALVAIPILAPAVMPAVFADHDLTIIKIDIPDPPPPPRRVDEIEISEPRRIDGPPIVAPTGFSPERPIETGWDTEPAGGTIAGSTIDTTFGSAPPPEAKTPSPQPVRVGGVIRTPVKTHHVNPVYPPIAQAARIQGIVIIEATIGEDGSVTSARILRSVPLLDQAAIDAVRLWQFTPTTLNGVKVPVIMTVTVNFNLQ